MKSAVFLDRDGVINEAIVRGGRPFSPRNLAEFRINYEVIDEVINLRNRGFEIVVVTNQPDIAQGHVSEDFVLELHKQIQERVGINHFYVCPHSNEDNCACRKPKPGLILNAALDLGINLRTSYLIGDRWKDIEAGNIAGCKTILIDYHYAEEEASLPHVRVDSLVQATRHILEASIE